MRDLAFLILSVPVALAAAAIVWLWWRSPIPTFYVFTPILQGMLVGLGAMWLAARLKINWKLVRVCVGALAGCWSIVALVQLQYRSAAHEYLDQRRRAIAAMAPSLASGGAVVPDLRAGARQLYDRDVLQPATGSTGMVGYLQLDNRRAAWRWHVRNAEWVLIVLIAGALSYAGGRHLREVD